MSTGKERRTRQRQAIGETIENAHGPLSPGEILDRARLNVPGMGLATVYRNLKRLVAEGAVRPVELPGEASRYESADRGHHHHFHCRRCDRVFEVEKCAGPVQGLAPRGFRVESHDLTLFGVCRECGSTEAGQSP